MASKTIEVTQSAAAANLGITETTLTMGATSGLVKTFKIQSNVSDWIITKDAWLTLSTTTGSDSLEITVTASSNTGTQRQGAITITGGGIIKTITVTQDANPNSIVSINNMFTVYPNPTKGLINIEMNGSGNAVDIQIINLLGMVVKTSKLQQNKSVVDLNGLVNGTYFIRVASGNECRIQPIVKQ